MLVKVVNESTVKKPLRILQPAGRETVQRQRRTESEGRSRRSPSRFLRARDVSQTPPMTDELSGLKAEYAIALIYSTEAGKREATIGFDVGQGNQDLGFRGETAVLFDVKPAVRVKLKVSDFDGKPTVGRFTFTDAAGHVFPPKAKRLAPDLFFQDQVYRADGGVVLLPPGEFTVEYGRGPEYRLKRQKSRSRPTRPIRLTVKLERWINPADYGWYSGDHHIHAAGCAHYTNPTRGRSA